jgi:2-polyprenyl-3-methyl-5-hydroxy-6-metoxy-1,4-benzoquinol methylase
LQEFFDNHAPQYMQNVFTKNTEFEIGFILEELSLEPGNRILDLGCGTGRHSVPLAGHGMEVTGLDLSGGMLAQARKYADEKNVNPEFVQGDATRFSFDTPFDHVICLCEGSFGLLAEKDNAAERDLAILKNIHACLRPGGMLLMTVLNGLKKIREHSPEDINLGIFDPINLVTIEKMSIQEAGGSHEISVREKGFTPSELHHLFVRARLGILELWGGTAGSWHKKALEMDEYEIMILAQKPQE